MENTNDVYQLTAGFEGSFPNNDMTWEFNASTGQTDTRNDYRNLPSLQAWRWMNALPLFGAGNATGLPGQPGNNIGQAGLPQVAPGSSAGHHVFGREYVLDCPSGLPIFGGFQNLHPACLDSLDTRAKAASVLTQDIYEFNLQGKVADMPAGELRFAAGVAYRDNTFKFEPLNDNRTISNHPVGLFVSDNTYGEMNVKEIYGELLMPVTSRLDLEFGYRYSEFDTAAGDVDTWKALFDYAVTDSINLRGGFQQATRAPNTAEMFQGPIMLTVPFGPSDPCTFTTTAPWGNIATNPRRAEVQALCIALIGNPNTPMGGAPGTRGQQLRAARRRVLPARKRAREGRPEPHRGKRRHLDIGRGVLEPRRSRKPDGLDRHLQHRDDGRYRAQESGVHLRAVLQRERHEQPDVVDQRSGRLLSVDRPPAGDRRARHGPDAVRQPGRSEDLGSRLRGQLGNGYGQRRVVLHQLRGQRAERVSGSGLAVRAVPRFQGDYRDSPRRGSVRLPAEQHVRLRLRRRQDERRAAMDLFARRSRTLPRFGRRRGCSASTRTVCSTCSRVIRSTSGCRCVVVSTTCSTRSRPLSGAIRARIPAAGCPGSPNCNNNSANTNAQYYDILGRRAYVAIKMSF